MPNLPNVALSINQPWAWLIAAGYKDIENRNWNTDFRGEFAIHAGLKVDRDAIETMLEGRHPVTGQELDAGLHAALVAELAAKGELDRGGIVGAVSLHGVITQRTGGAEKPWFVGRYGFMLRNGRQVDLVPCTGVLGFFKPDFTSRYKPKPEPKGRAKKSPPAAAAPMLGLFD